MIRQKEDDQLTGIQINYAERKTSRETRTKSRLQWGLESGNRSIHLA